MRDTTIDEMDAEMMGYGGVVIFFKNIYIFAVTASFYEWSHMFLHCSRRSRRILLREREGNS